jgi:hypothetical protein
VSSFDYGPFSREDWAWLLAEARKHDQQAVVVLLTDWMGKGNNFLVASSLDGEASCCWQHGRSFHWDLGTDAKRFLKAAQDEKRVYPDHAEPEQESDEDWLKRVVFELTGLPCKIRTGSTFVLVCADGHDGTVICFTRAEIGRRNVTVVRERSLSESGWPLKSATPTPPPSPAQPVGELAKRCAECGAPHQNRGDWCGYCATRGDDANTAEQTDLEPSQQAARARLTALEKRSRPRRTKWQRELSRPAPWSGPDEWEP